MFNMISWRIAYIVIFVNYICRQPNQVQSTTHHLVAEKCLWKRKSFVCIVEWCDFLTIWSWQIVIIIRDILGKGERWLFLLHPYPHPLSGENLNDTKIILQLEHWNWNDMKKQKRYSTKAWEDWRNICLEMLFDASLRVIGWTSDPQIVNI